MEEDLQRLLPCPFCGGGTTQIRENGRVWVGMKYSDPVSVSIFHWCDEVQGPSRPIERVGKDKEHAIDQWNMRSSSTSSPKIGGVMSFKYLGSRGVMGTTLGADGSGEYAVVFYGHPDDCHKAATKYHSDTLQKLGSRVKEFHYVVDEERYSGESIEHITALEYLNK